MGQRQRLSLYIPGSPPGALPQCTTYTPASTSSDRRRSLISLDGLSFGNLSSLKPTKAKLQKYWPGGKSPATNKNQASSSTHDLSALIMLAGEQMGALGDPRRRRSSSSSSNNNNKSNNNSPVLARRPVSCASPAAASARRDDLMLQQHLELSLPKSATSLSRRSSIHRKPLPAGSVVPALGAPKRAPPPPPIPELSAVNFYSEEQGGNVSELDSPSSPIMPVSPVLVRRRAKTPVHHIGQLELAAQRRRNEQAAAEKATVSGNMDGINRMSSVSTIAREYRELAVYAELDDDVPAVPKIDPSYLLQQGLVELPATEMKHADSQYDGNLLCSPDPSQRHHRHRASASSLSDDGTVLGSEAGSSVGTCPSLTHSNSPGGELSEAEGEEEEEEEDAPPALASLRFQIGLELLTKELSTAFAGQSGRREKEADPSSSSAGLQIWVMIEAYERLREQLDAKPTEENKQARDAIDSWIKALNTIHANMASEAAGDDSDYEENP